MSTVSVVNPTLPNQCSSTLNLTSFLNEKKTKNKTKLLYLFFLLFLVLFFAAEARDTFNPGFFNAGARGCKRCRKGTFQPKKDQAECIPCPKNSFSGRGFTSYTVGPKGTVLMVGGKCGSCPPGTRYIQDRLRCDPCYREFFQPNQNIRCNCFRCPKGSQSEKGATKCIKCPRGELLMNNGKCRACPPGSVYDVSFRNCRKCPVTACSEGAAIENARGVLRQLFAFPGSTLRRVVSAPSARMDNTWTPRNKGVYVSSVQEGRSMTDIWASAPDVGESISQLLETNNVSDVNYVTYSFRTRNIRPAYLARARECRRNSKLFAGGS